MIVIYCLLNSCSSKSANIQDDDEDYESSYNSEYNDSEDISICNYEDGTYSATVDYENLETGYYARYTLDVDVQDCQVIQINFPNDGYLDEDHILYTDIDENGDAIVNGEEGKMYKVHINDL